MRVQIGKSHKMPFHLAACLTILSATMIAQAQTLPATAPAQSTIRTISLTIFPKPFEKPDLAFALLPKIEDTQKGNAAVKYLTALVEMASLPNDDLNTTNNLLATPLQDIDEATVKKILDNNHTSYLFHVARDGAHLDSADWETNSRTEGVYALIPSMGRFKKLANLLGIAIRLDIKNHRWSEAQDKLQTGYALARHLDQGETLIESLVGIAIAESMNHCVEDWVSQPDAPNLYWPLANLPHPFNDLRKPMAFESAEAIFTFPEMREMRDGQYSPEEWISFVNHFNKYVSHFVDYRIGGKSSADDRSALPPWRRQFTGVAFAAVEYPIAKQFLVARGLKPEEVEKMTVPEVLGRFFIRSHAEICDNALKWFALPPPEAIAGAAKADREFYSQTVTNQMDILSMAMMQGFGRVPFLAAQVDRHVDMLRIVEAIRAYAVQNGSLPDSLQQLPLPVPMDSVTAMPFSYQHTGDTATLTAQGPEQLNDTDRQGIRYAIKLGHP